MLTMPLPSATLATNPELAMWPSCETMDMTSSAVLPTETAFGDGFQSLEQNIGAYLEDDMFAFSPTDNVQQFSSGDIPSIDTVTGEGDYYTLTSASPDCRFYPGNAAGGSYESATSSFTEAGYGGSPLSPTLWGSPLENRNFDMKSVFQVDEDRVPSRTLAELNSKDDVEKALGQRPSLGQLSRRHHYQTMFDDNNNHHQQAKAALFNDKHVTVASLPPFSTLTCKQSGDATVYAPYGYQMEGSAYEGHGREAQGGYDAGVDDASYYSKYKFKDEAKTPTLHTLLTRSRPYPAPQARLSGTDQQLYAMTVPSALCSEQCLSTLSRNRPGRGGKVGRSDRKQQSTLGVPGHLMEIRDRVNSFGSCVSDQSNTTTDSGNLSVGDKGDSHDEGFDSQPDESDQFDDSSNDGESLGSDDCSLEPGRNNSMSEQKGAEGGVSNKDKVFWQYNVQSKGPKGNRLSINEPTNDPYHLGEVTDPVFSPSCRLQGIKHSGKARKGDGNDLTPNPKKLHLIGVELRKLNKTINDMAPVSELPFNARSKSRKEKNKLASRACRLKKKAQHEANKLKLYGLEQEHRKLMSALDNSRRLITARVNEIKGRPSTSTSAIHAPSMDTNQESMESQFDKLVLNDCRFRVAGNTTEYVNKILERVVTPGSKLYNAKLKAEPPNATGECFFEK